jgi:hypothetical protein
MKHLRLSPDQERALKMSTENEGRLFRFPNGVWSIAALVDQRRPARG